MILLHLAVNSKTLREKEWPIIVVKKTGKCSCLDLEDVVEDRGINMKMAFKEHEGLEHIIDLKLEKFAVNGTYLGIKDLTSQLMYCERARPSIKTSNLDIVG